MASIGFRIRSSFKKQVPVYIYVYPRSGKRVEGKTGFWISPDDWDKQNQCAIGSDANAVVINAGLNRLESYFLSLINDPGTDFNELNTEWLDCHVRNCFDLPTEKRTSLLLYQIEQYIERAPSKRVRRTGSIGLSDNSVRNLMRFYELVEAFEKCHGSSINLLKLDEKLVYKFQQWLLGERGYSLNSAGLQLKLLKMICKQAERSGVKVNPYFRHIEVFSQPSKDRYLQTLSFAEIDQIKALEGLSATLENTRLWMLIGLFIGQRVSDLLTLRSTQVRKASKGVYIDIYQKKTEKFVTVGVMDPEVLYILEESFPYQIAPQQFNQQIKVICELAGITQLVRGYKKCSETNRLKLGEYPKCSLISSHDLRRSFATNYFGVINKPILMQITGHSKESTFLSYIGKEPSKDHYADAFIRGVMKLKK